MNPLLTDFSNSVLEWLEDPTPQAGMLEKWLQGYDLPPFGHDEPYLWLWRALQLAATGDQITEMARRAAAVLDTAHEVSSTARRPKELLHNMLNLCAALRRAPELGPALTRMYGRQRLAGEWEAVSLRASLTRAIITNQISADFEWQWILLLDGARPDFLEGNRYTGFEGEVRVPDPDSAGPNLAAIARALGRMALYLDSEPKADRDRRFNALLERATEVHPDLNDWRDVADRLREEGAPAWACTATTNRATTPQANHQGVIEDYILEVIKEFKKESLLRVLTIGNGRFSKQEIENLVQELRDVLHAFDRQMPIEALVEAIRIKKSAMAYENPWAAVALNRAYLTWRPKQATLANTYKAVAAGH